MFVSSLSGKAAGPHSSLYSATKFGLRGFSLGLRQDLAPHGIGVSCVFPGFVRGAGMFVDSGVTLPPGVGTSSPEEVAAGDGARDRAGPRRGRRRPARHARRGARRWRRAGVERVGPAAAGRLPGRAGHERRPARQALATSAQITVTTRPRGAGALVATPARALALTILAGAGIPLQSYINGRLGADVGSATVAAAINNAVALSAGVALVLVTGALPRALARVRAAGRRPPAWQFLGGLGGAALVLVSAAAAPEVGVALLTVAVVCGSTGGSLPVDAAGLGPAGRRPITAPRLAGVALAIAATAIATVGARSDLQPLLLALALLAGLGMAAQAAANGQLARATGEPSVALMVNSSVGLAALGLVAAVTLATTSIDALPATPLLYVGGLLGAFVVVVSAATVQTLGVLRLGLATVAGQATGALAIDLIAPVPGEAVTAATVIGVALTMVAVAVSGRGGPPQREVEEAPSGAGTLPVDVVRPC